MKNALYLLSLLMPWSVRRRLLRWVFHYDLHPTARIGLAWIMPEKLVMGPQSRIGHLTFCKGLELLQMDSCATIGRGNWITGFPRNGQRHFAHQADRRPILVIGEHSAITNRHLIDCTNAVLIGCFSTVAGFQSQILTHTIDLKANRQSSAPVTIGDYCFVGTNVVLLGGSKLPSYSVLGAKSLLNKAYSDEHVLYAGVPAKPAKALEEESKYFTRAVGFVI